MVVCANRKNFLHGSIFFDRLGLSVWQPNASKAQRNPGIFRGAVWLDSALLTFRLPSQGPAPLSVAGVFLWLVLFVVAGSIPASDSTVVRFESDQGAIACCGQTSRGERGLVPSPNYYRYAGRSDTTTNRINVRALFGATKR